MKKAKITRVFYCFVVVGFLSGCVTAQLKPAIMLDPGFQSANKSEITLLPTIDARIDKSVEVDVNEDVGMAVKGILEDKGYKVSVDGNSDAVEQLTVDELKSGDAAFIEKLGPGNAERVMVLLLLDVTSEMTFGSTGTAEVSGFMYDKVSKKMIWRDKGIGKVGQGGLLGMMMKGMMAGDAIRIANMNLIASVPEYKSEKLQ